jgi:hypothetical protein
LFIYINIIYDAFIIYYVPLLIYFSITFIHERGFKLNGIDNDQDAGPNSIFLADLGDQGEEGDDLTRGIIEVDCARELLQQINKVAKTFKFPTYFPIMIQD